MNNATRGVIKQGDFVSIAGIAPSSNMQQPVRSINNGEDGKSPALPNQDTASPDSVAAEPKPKSAEQKRFEAQTAKIERMKLQCEQECDQLLDQAREEARKTVSEAEAQAQSLRETAEGEAAEIRKQARETGYSDGFSSGETPGYEAGYGRGKDECKQTLEQLNAVLSRIPDEKEKIFKEHESQLFDLIFTISNKVTAGCLNQKDKPVISKMLKEAAKSFRGSSFIKVSLSKLDLEDSANVDLEDLTRIFGENQHIEFEVLKDAPKGTLILDNGSEIADAGIQTQLRMIENLGKGKFKDRTEDEEDLWRDDPDAP